MKDELRKRIEESPIHDFDYISFNGMKYPKNLLDEKKQKSSKWHEFLLGRIWDWIQENREIIIRTEPNGNALYLYVFVGIYGYTLIERRIRLI